MKNGDTPQEHRRLFRFSLAFEFRNSLVVQAPAPERPVDRGMAGSGLLAHVLTGKYADYVGFAIM